MKRLLFTFNLIFLILCFATSGFSAEGCVETPAKRASFDGKQLDIVVVEITCESAVGGAIAAETVTGVGGTLLGVYVDTGATPPTNGAYDVVVTASSMNNIDLLFGAGANLTTTSDIAITPAAITSGAPTFFYGDLVVTQTGNAVPSATPTVFLIFRL